MIWLRIRATGILSWARCWTFRFYKI